jgi:hypothetical protein
VCPSTGLRFVEVSSRGTGDLIDGHGGSNNGYMIFTAENGDKFFSRNGLVAQRVSGKLLVTWSGAITGGTGVSVTSSPIFDSLSPPQHGQVAGIG